MEGLVVTAGGKLEYGTRVANEGAGDPIRRTDVTQSAQSYLLERIHFEGEVYVRDILALLQDNPVLQQVFERLHASAFVDEAHELDARPYSGEYDPAGIEFLELFHCWEMDRDAGELVGGQRLSIRAVGFELREDYEVSGCQYPKGDRVRYAIALSPLADLLNLPLRVNDEVCLDDGHGDTEAAFGALRTVRVRPTLAQIIDGVLYELSIGGTPEEKAGLVKQLHQAEADDEGWTTFDSVEDLLKSMGISYQVPE